MIELPLTPQLVPARGTAAPLPPGLAKDAANDAATGFPALLRIALDPALPQGDAAEAPAEEDDATAEVDVAALLAWAPMPAEAATPRAQPSAAAAAEIADPRASSAAQRASGQLLVPGAAENPRVGETADALQELPLAPADAAPGFEHGLAAAGTAAPAHGASPVHASALHVAPRVAHPGFEEAFAARVSVAVRSGTETASIALNPPELGPVEMRVTVNDGTAHIVFAAEQALTREAISDALPRLREMLAAHGLQLADSFVGAELPQRDAPAPQGIAADDAPASDEAAAPPPPLHAIDARLVDTFV